MVMMDDCKLKDKSPAVHSIYAHIFEEGQEESRKQKIFQI